MGFNTTVFILNDQLSSIERDPGRFVRDISRGLNDGDDHALGQTTVMHSEHADVPRLYYTCGNTIVELSAYSKRTKEIYERASYTRDWVDSAIAEAKQMIERLEEAKAGWDVAS